ncbi:MAG: galactosyltransferase-related protein, partial [Planctomycetota bacterium]
GVALLGYCARLPEATSRALVPGTLGSFDLAALAPAGERRALAHRRLKAWWYTLLRHPSKPRLAGGNFAVWQSDFRRVNGFDERFRGWGQEDDDLGLRLRATGVRLESILHRTNSLHVWHPSDPSATLRWRDGANVEYFERRGRLTCCRQGLEQRPAAAILWGLPADLQATASGALLDRTLAEAPRAAPEARCEIDIVLRPGTGEFRRMAECRLLLCDGPPEGHSTAELSRLRRQADRVATLGAAPAPDGAAAWLRGILDDLG